MDIYPVTAWRGRRPVITDGYYPRKTAGHREHHGVDIMFRRERGDAFSFPMGSPNGTKHFVMPDDANVVAWRDGKLWSAGWTPRGYAVVIDHGPAPFATFYQHLQTLDVPLRQAGAGGPIIRAGQRLGTVGASPLDAEGIKHLHFEIWRGGASEAHVDPAPYLAEAQVISDPFVLEAPLRMDPGQPFDVPRATAPGAVAQSHPRGSSIVPLAIGVGLVAAGLLIGRYVGVDDDPR